MDFKKRNRLREARVRLGLTQRELAEMAGLNLSTLCRMDANPGARISFENAILLGRALRMKAEDLIVI